MLMCTAGPCIGGIIVTFTGWRLIYWVQVAMVGLGLVGSLVFVPDIKQIDKHEEVFTEKRADKKTSVLQALAKFNPGRIFGPLIYPNVLFAVSLPFFAFSTSSPNPLIFLFTSYCRI